MNRWALISYFRSRRAGAFDTKAREQYLHFECFYHEHIAARGQRVSSRVLSRSFVEEVRLRVASF